MTLLRFPPCHLVPIIIAILILGAIALTWHLNSFSAHRPTLIRQSLDTLNPLDPPISSFVLPDPLVCNQTALVRDYELSSHLLVPPRSNWGSRMRKEKTLHILALGGSNSNGEDRWPEIFADALKLEFPNISSLVINQAIPGLGISHTIGRTYPFEHEPPHLWPSVVILESAVNCDRNKDCLQDHEAITKYLRLKWLAHDLPPPDFLILELIKLGELYVSFQGKNDTFISRYQHFIEFDKSKFRNSHISDFARFYRIPMISLVDAFLPSIVRHFLNCPIAIKWMYSVDFMHIHKSTHEILVQQMLLPLIKHQFLKTTTSDMNMSAIYDEPSISYLPPNDVSGVIEFTTMHTWSSWNHRKSLQNIILDSPGWSFTNLRGHKKGSHVCFGSTTKGTSAKFQFWGSSKCRIRSPCVLEIHYIHSWNTSYIGNANCSVLQSSDTWLPIATVFINGSAHKGVPVQDTVPRVVQLASLDREGNYTISCLNLDDKLACISAVILRGMGAVE